MTYNDKFQETEHGLLYVIHKVELFTEDGFIASLYVRHYSDIDIMLKIAEVRECLSIAHREFLSLSKFSLTFNTRWATEKKRSVQYDSSDAEPAKKFACFYQEELSG